MEIQETAVVMRIMEEKQKMNGKARSEKWGKTIIWTVHHHNAPLLLLQLLYSMLHAAATLIYITIKSTTGLLAFLKQSLAAKWL